ncbi:hypothetical protein NHJ6243_009966 [Beauveria neobassiana]
MRVTHRLIYLFKEVQREEIDRATTLKLRSKKPLKLIINNDTRWLSLSDNAVSVGSVRKRSVWVANSVVTLLPARQQFPEVFKYRIVKFREG